MARQRDAIRMSDEEIAAFLDSARSLIVATIGKDGAPHQTVLWFRRHEGALLFETYGSSQKVVNLRRDPRVSALCEAGETYGELRGVSIQGKAEIVDSGPRLEQLMRLIVDRNAPGQDPETLAAHVAAMIRKRVVVVVHPEKVISWDHRKLAAPMAG
jgi:PPOX class probable F420-dependent enzyme